MALLDNAQYNEWERAYHNLKRRREFFEAANALPAKHALVKHCQDELAKAQAEYDRICSELD